MRIIRGSDITYIPASHEDKNNPGVLKKVLTRKNDLLDGRIMMINWAKLPKQKSFAPHFHEDMEEVFIIVSGSVLITVGEETEKMEKGDMVIIPVKSIHTMENKRTIDCEYIALGISKGDGTGKTVNA